MAVLASANRTAHPPYAWQVADTAPAARNASRIPRARSYASCTDAGDDADAAAVARSTPAARPAAVSMAVSVATAPLVGISQMTSASVARVMRMDRV
jgi:hypothetical protein